MFVSEQQLYMYIIRTRLRSLYSGIPHRKLWYSCETKDMGSDQFIALVFLFWSYRTVHLNNYILILPMFLIMNINYIILFFEISWKFQVSAIICLWVIRYTENIITFLQNYCKLRNFQFSPFNRTNKIHFLTTKVTEVKYRSII